MSQPVPPSCIARLAIFSPVGYFDKSFHYERVGMKDYSDSAMIALLPMDASWSKLDLPHLTLVYAGEISKLKSSSYNEMAKTASSLALMTNSIMLVSAGVETFGTDEPVDVLRFRPSQEILAMRTFVEEWNASEHPFSPHITIGPVGSAPQELPEMVYFNRVYLSYGEHNMTFKI